MKIEKNFRITTRTVLLFILLVLLIYLAIGAVNFSNKTARAKSEYDELHSELTGGESISNPYATTAPDRVVLDSVPDHIANRGIVLRGRFNEDLPQNPYRRSATGKQGMWGPVWWQDYVCDCNLSVESTNDDIVHFCHDYSFYGEDKLKYDFRGETIYDVLLDDGQNSFQIFRTCLAKEECSDGSVYFEDDPGYYRPVFFDPTGKYIFLLNSDLKDDELLLKFLEPKFVKVEIVVTGSEEDEDEDISTANNGVINDYIEAMHEMEFTMIDENPIAALDSSRVACLSLTAENGIVHDYYFTAEGYMVNDDIVYEIGETDITIPLTPEPDWSDNELLNNMEQVDGPLR